MKIITTSLLAVFSLSNGSATSLYDSDINNRFINQSIDKLESQQRIQPRNIITVGFDGDCSHSSIQTAMDDAISGTQIRLSSAAEFTEDVIFPVKKNLTLKGGYDNCSKAALDQANSNKSIINGTGNQSVIRIQTSSPQSLILENLHIKNGSGQANGYQGGGISAFNANAFVSLKNIDITDNNGLRGGGIYIFEGNPTFFLDDVNIEYNNALYDGGGIHCSKLKSGGLIMNLGRINENQSINSSGGGAFHNECFSAYISTSILLNTAHTHGGGLALIDTDSRLYGFLYCANAAKCLGNKSNPVLLDRNSANDFDQGIMGMGGGIYSVNTNIIASSININENQAAFGGGIWQQSGQLLMTSPNSLSLSDESCWNPKFCNVLKKNITAAVNTIGGGGLYFDQGSQALISHTHFTNNVAHYGSALASKGINTVVKIETSLFTDHKESNQLNPENNILIHVGDPNQNENPSLEMAYVTITDNNIEHALISNTGGNVKVHSSIIHENNGVTVLDETDNNSNSEFHCIIAHEINSIGPWFNEVDNPQFVNPQNQDYRLKPSSPAIDYCFKEEDPLFMDIEHETRGYNWDGMADHLGPYDLGIDEYKP